MERIKQILYAILVISLFMLPGFWAGNEAHGATVDNDTPPKIKTAGKTKDGKYPLYAIHGDVDGFMWYNGHYSYTLTELYTAGVGLLDKKDVNHPYKCTAVCVDDKRRMVGLNPNYFFIRDK